MDEQVTQINCPECGKNIDLNKAIASQFNDKLDERIQTGLKDGRKEIEDAIKKKLAEEHAESDKVLKNELKEYSGKVKELNKTKADLSRLEREKDELKSKFEHAAEEKLNAKLAKQKRKIRKSMESESSLKISEYQHVIEQLNKQLKEAQRKAEQGSMQLQGEVQELAIEEWLKTEFPIDSIEEIKKGARGADCLQTVSTNTQLNCGTIYYESKRAKDFRPSWIEKFKTDIRDKNADIGVLVTQVMPSDMGHLGLRNGIWICSFEEFKGLATALRMSIIKTSNIMISQENKGEKMGMLYDYLTSNDFQLAMEALAEGFTQMKADLEFEKRAMQRIWGKREKQIEKVFLNANHMYGSVKGIAGSSLKSVELLDLPSDTEEEVD